MKRILLVLALFPLALMAQVGSKEFTIDGKLEGHADGTDVLMYKNGENVEMAKTKVMGNKFTLKGTVKEPVLCFIIVGTEKPIEVYVENAAISVKGKKSEPAVYEIEGSASHKDFDTFLKDFMPYAKQLSSLANTINTTPAGADRDKLSALYNTT